MPRNSIHQLSVKDSPQQIVVEQISEEEEKTGHANLLLMYKNPQPTFESLSLFIELMNKRVLPSVKSRDYNQTDLLNFKSLIFDLKETFARLISRGR